MTDTDGLNTLLSDIDVLLVDFDGPICSIFDSYRATAVADDIRQIIRATGIDLNGSIVTNPDPMALLAWSDATGRPEIARLIEDALSEAELKAAATARPTAGADDVFRAAYARGVPVAIVSNNSPRAISAYLRRTRLDELIAFVAGRSYAAPALLKPNPDVVRRALKQLDIEPRRAVLVGDTPRDIEAARAAGTASIGYANRAAKYESLARAGADVVADDMADIAAALGA